MPSYDDLQHYVEQAAPYWYLTMVLYCFASLSLFLSTYSPDDWDIIHDHSLVQCWVSWGFVFCIGSFVYCFQLLCERNVLIKENATPITTGFAVLVMYFCGEPALFVFVTSSAAAGYFTYVALNLPKCFEVVRPLLFTGILVVMAIYLRKQWSCCIVIVLFGLQVFARMLPFLERKSKKRVSKSKKET